MLTPPALLVGTVVDEAEKPVADAEVSVVVAISEIQLESGGRNFAYLTGKPAGDTFKARTGADGRFRIEGFPSNATASLTVKVAGKAPRSGQQESFSPDSLPFHAGQDDIQLVVEPAGSVEGKIVAEGGSSSLPVARLFIQPEGPTYFGKAAQEPVESRTDGTFCFPDIAAGNYRVRAMFGTNGTPEWVAESVSASVESGQVTRDLQLHAIRGGLLQVTVVGKTKHQPRPQAQVSASREQYQAAGTADPDGVVLLRLPPGDYQVNAFVQGASQENSSASVEAGKTNRLEIELADPLKVTGVVRGPDDKPAPGLEVRLVGGFSAGGDGIKTEADGKFEMEWNPRQFGRSDRTYCVLVRDPVRNLAAAEEVDEDTGSLELRLAPAMTVVGRAECDGKPLTNATAALVFWTGNSGMHLQGMTVNTNTPGRFEIPALPVGRRYGLYITAPGYGQQYVSSVDSDEAKRVEVDPVELKPANLKLAGQVLDADDQPVPGVYVSLNGEGQRNSNARTDREGRFRFDHVCEGTVRLYANVQRSQGSVSAEGGDTNVVLRLGEQSDVYSGGGVSWKLKGAVTDLEGKPAAGVLVSVFPFNSSRWVKTGATGDFSLSWTVPQRQMQQGGDPWLVVRDLSHNLAVAETISEGITNLNVQLKPALTVLGRVEGPDGAPLINAQIGVWLTACRTSSHLSEQLASSDSQGNFEIKTVPLGPEYRVYAKAKDHGKKQIALATDAETNRVTLPPFVLKAADQVVAGQVVGLDDKPVSGVRVSLSGEDQPDGSVTTDRTGRFCFKVCDGPIRLFASGQNGYADATATPGDTNVVIQLTRSGYSSIEAPRRPSLIGKALPDLASVGLAAAAAPAGKPLLLCLLDAEQRPSRRVARLVAEQCEALEAKGVTVAAVQVVTASAESFQQWTNSSPVTFPLGFIGKKLPANKWATGVASLPWLILRDAQGNVTAEGFALDELDAKLEGLKK